MLTNAAAIAAVRALRLADLESGHPFSVLHPDTKVGDLADLFSEGRRLEIAQFFASIGLLSEDATSENPSFGRPFHLETGKSGGGVIVFGDGKTVSLKSGCWKLIVCFARQEGRIVSLEEIGSALSLNVDTAVRPLIGRVRTKIGDRSVLENVHGRGYRFLVGSYKGGSEALAVFLQSLSGRAKASKASPRPTRKK